MRWEDQLGANVRRLRRETGLTQEALAHEAGMSVRYLAGLERGEENPSLAFIVRLAEALAVEPADLLARSSR